MPEQTPPAVRLRAERPEVVLARRTRAAVRPVQKLVSALNERLAYLSARQLHSDIRREGVDLSDDVSQLQARTAEAEGLLRECATRLAPDEIASSYFQDVELAIASLRGKLARLAEPGSGSRVS